jgi:hypothetical protein
MVMKQCWATACRSTHQGGMGEKEVEEVTREEEAMVEQAVMEQGEHLQNFHRIAHKLSTQAFR